MVLSYDAYADSKNELEEMRKIKNTEEVNSDAISILSDQVTKLIWGDRDVEGTTAIRDRSCVDMFNLSVLLLPNKIRYFA